MNDQDANGCTPTAAESPLARRHRKLLEAADRVKEIVEEQERPFRMYDLSPVVVPTLRSEDGRQPCGWCDGEGAMRDGGGRLGEDCTRCNGCSTLRGDAA